MMHMNDLVIAIGVMFILSLIYSIIKAKRAKKFVDPFELWKMYSRLQCNKCGHIIDRPFKRFEYVNQEVNDYCRKCSKSSQIIIGIYADYEESPEEKKWKEFEKRWR